MQDDNKNKYLEMHRKTSQEEMNQTQIVEDIRFALRKNKAVVLKLFQNRQVQPTEHVVRIVAPFALRSPLDPREVSILGDVLDPNKINFVSLKRIKELTSSEDEEEESVQLSSSLAVVAQDDKNNWQPPKRAPPNPHSSSTSLTLSALGNNGLIQRDSKDPDMQAIISAISWSGRHLAQTSVLNRRYASSPLARYVVPLTATIIPSSRGNTNLAPLADALRRTYSNEERGWAAAAMLATQVRSEIVFRDSMKEDVPLEIVPEDVLDLFFSTPRRFRHSVLDSAKAENPNEIFLSLSPVRLPLAVTALKVELESSARKVMNAFLPQEVIGAWQNATEELRAEFVTSLLDLNIWDDDFFSAMGGEGLQDIILTQKVYALEYRTPEDNLDEAQIKIELDRIIQRIEEVSNLAKAPIRTGQTQEAYGKGLDPDDPSLTSDDMDAVELTKRISRLCADLWL